MPNCEKRTPSTEVCREWAREGGIGKVGGRKRVVPGERKGVATEGNKGQEDEGK